MKKLYIICISLCCLFISNIGYSHEHINHLIDSSVNDRVIILNSIPNSLDDFYLFTHGKSGELFIEGKWLDAKQISKWFIDNVSVGEFESIQIYSCEFAKGEKGLNEIAYMQKVLNSKIAASDDITGKDGDWELEIGEDLKR